MLVERVEFLVTEGKEEEFAAVMKDQGVPLLSTVPRVISAKIGRGVENPGKFMLLIEWEAMDAHAAFSNSPAAGVFRQLVAPFRKSASMEHFEMR